MEISNTKISYPKIIDHISNQINILAREIKNGTDEYSTELASYVNGLTFFVSDEQAFVKLKDVKDNGVYIVVKFGSASTNFGNSICPVNLIVFGTKNKIKPAQMFFSAFCSRWSLQPLSGSEEEQSKQLWVTPQVSSNFNEVNEGFRSLFNVSGTLVIAQSMVKIGSLYYKWGPNEADVEKIDFLAFQDNFSNALAPQPFGNTFGYAKSETNFSTYSFSISTYLLDTHLTADAMAIKGFRNRNNGLIGSVKEPNDIWEIYIEFSNGFTNKKVSFDDYSSDEIRRSDFFQKFKCASVSFGEKIGDIDTLNIAFSR